MILRKAYKLNPRLRACKYIWSKKEEDVCVQLALRKGASVDIVHVCTQVNSMTNLK